MPVMQFISSSFSNLKTTKQLVLTVPADVLAAPTTWSSEGPVCCGARVRFWQILLQKSFCTGDQKFSGPYTRFSGKDVGDLIA
jgi:hypothetical protein